MNCALNSATLRPFIKKIGNNGRILRAVRNYQVWAIVGSASLISAFSPSFYGIGAGLRRSKKKSDEHIQTMVIIEKKTDRFFTAPITNADIK